MVTAMPEHPVRPEPPPLPSALQQVWPVIGVGGTCWSVAFVAAFSVPVLHTWRPVTLAGLATGLFGTGLFLWQRAAARRGARGAQSGLAIPHTPDIPEA